MNDITLTHQQIANYHTQGWISLPPLAPPAEIERLRDVYDALFARRVGWEWGQQFDLFGEDNGGAANVPQIHNPHTLAPEIGESVLWRNAQRVLEQLFGQSLDYVTSHAILKTPHSPFATPWHQDEAYWGAGIDYCSASVWIPLQNVDETTGCMHFVPRSHLGEILPHRPVGNNPKIAGLELDGDVTDLSNAVSVPLPAGGCTVHHHRLLHYTTPNQGAAPRRALVMVGGLNPIKRHGPKRLPWLENAKLERRNRAQEYQRDQQQRQAEAISQLAEIKFKAGVRCPRLVTTVHAIGP